MKKFWEFKNKINEIFVHIDDDETTKKVANIVYKRLKIKIPKLIGYVNIPDIYQDKLYQMISQIYYYKEGRTNIYIIVNIEEEIVYRQVGGDVKEFILNSTEDYITKKIIKDILSTYNIYQYNNLYYLPSLLINNFVIDYLKNYKKNIFYEEFLFDLNDGKIRIFGDSNKYKRSWASKKDIELIWEYKLDKRIYNKLKKHIETAKYKNEFTYSMWN
jgi:hypothetical protein